MLRDRGAGVSSWKLTQIGLVVRDMQRAVERFAQLGIGPFEPKVLPPGTRESINGEPSLAEITVQGTMVGNVEVELCQPVSGDSPHKDYLESKGEGIQHVLFTVDNLDAEISRLTGLGCKVLLEARFGEEEGTGRLAYVDLDASGLVVELLELPTKAV